MSDDTTTVTPAEALRLSEAANAANEAVQVARNLLYLGEPNDIIDGYLGRVQEQTEKAAGLAFRIAGRDVLPPIAVSGHSVGEACGPLSTLSSLAALDTADSRELLELLTRALAAAERVDAQRGNRVAEGTPLQPGESRGTDIAEALSVLRLRLWTEIHGPQTGRE